LSEKAASHAKENINFADGNDNAESARGWISIWRSIEALQNQKSAEKILTVLVLPAGSILSPPVPVQIKEDS
jgi:hypothetical protein